MSATARLALEAILRELAEGRPAPLKSDTSNEGSVLAGAADQEGDLLAA